MVPHGSKFIALQLWKNAFFAVSRSEASMKSIKAFSASSLRNFVIEGVTSSSLKVKLADKKLFSD
jgi:hypothetical protein